MHAVVYSQDLKYWDILHTYSSDDFSWYKILALTNIESTMMSFNQASSLFSVYHIYMFGLAFTFFFYDNSFSWNFKKTSFCSSFSVEFFSFCYFLFFLLPFICDKMIQRGFIPTHIILFEALDRRHFYVFWSVCS